MATKNAELRNRMVTDFGAIFNGGQLLIQNNAAQTLVAITLQNPAFTAPSPPGVISLAGLPLSANATQAGTADRAELRSGTHAITGITVSLTGGGGQVQLNALAVNVGQTVVITSFSWTEQATVN